MRPSFFRLKMYLMRDVRNPQGSTSLARSIHEVRREGPQVETDARKRAIRLRNILLIREHRRIVL